VNNGDNCSVTIDATICVGNVSSQTPQVRGLPCREHAQILSGVEEAASYSIEAGDRPYPHKHCGVGHVSTAVLLWVRQPEGEVQKISLPQLPRAAPLPGSFAKGHGATEWRALLYRYAPALRYS
jgi:hypothetical protein